MNPLFVLTKKATFFLLKSLPSLDKNSLSNWGWGWDTISYL